MLDCELIIDPSYLQELAPAWDELAVVQAQPMGSPTWMLSWLRHLAPASASARVVAAREGKRLVGVAPFFVDEGTRGRLDYRLLGDNMPRSSPLAVPGREREVAESIAATLAGVSPRPDVIAFESVSAGSHWTMALRDGWPGRLRPPTRQYHVLGSPTVSLREESFDAWLGGKSSNFRGQMRRAQRQFAAAGGTTRMSTLQTLDADLFAYMRLHEGRWQGRGESSIVALGDRLRTALADIGRAHIESGRFRLWMLDVDGQPVSAQLFAEAGGELLYLNGGWDERFAKFKPAMLGILRAVEDAFARGDQRLDLAPGEQHYKLRFADGNDPVAWSILMVPSRRLALTFARSAPMLTRIAVRESVKRALTTGQSDRLRSLRRRFRSVALRSALHGS